MNENKIKIYGIIYQAINTENNKRYVGATEKSLVKRRADHILAAEYHTDEMIFHKKIRKYGKGLFEWEILQECINKDEFIKAEIAWQKYFNTTDSNFGYNSQLGNRRSNELIEYMKIKNGGKNNPRYGIKHTEETKRKISIKSKAYWAKRKNENKNN